MSRSGLVLAIAALGACSLPVAEPRPLAPAAPREGRELASPPPRFVVPHSDAWIERTEGGVDRVVVGGRRLETRGHEIVALALLEPEIDAGARQPPWARGAADAAAYVFWRGREVFVASSFLGPLTKAATLAGDVTRAAPWFGGVALLGATGVRVELPSGGAPVPLGSAGAVDVLALDARSGLALDAFGRASAILDAGAAVRDLSSELDGAIALGAGGGELRVALRGGGSRAVGASGAVRAVPSFASEVTGHEPPDLEDRWPEHLGDGALEAAVRSGVLLHDGTALAVSGGTYARVDLRTGRAISLGAIPERDAECTAIRGPDAHLLACIVGERAMLFDVGGVPRAERTFDLAGAPELDRFVAVDGEALGFVGPCVGASERPVADAVSGASPVNQSPQRSAVFCARASAEAWVEHRLGAEDAHDVIAWIPRRGGEATALVARDGALLAREARVAVKGPLRVIRVARTEPPLSLPPYQQREPLTVVRELRAGPDGSIEGWMPASTSPSGVVAIEIDSDGLPRLFSAPPRLQTIATAGARALAATDDGKLLETVDRGRTWSELAAAPAAQALPSSCTEVGCSVGPLVRLGWSAPGRDALEVSLPASVEEPLDARPPRESPPIQAIARLSCAPASPPTGGRIGGSRAFGLGRSPVPRTTRTVRLGTLGTMLVPAHSPGLPPSGDFELAWVAPLDPAGVVHRAAVPFARAASDGQHGLDARLAWLLDASGGVEAFSVGSRGCAAEVLEAASVTRRLGGCVPDASVGVIAGDRLFAAGFRGEALALSVVPLRAARSGALGRAREEAGDGARALGVVRLPRGARQRALGLGTRRGAPFAIAVDASGEAILAPIDPERGVLGPSEPLAPLSTLALGSAPACARGAPDEVHVLLPLEGQIELAREALRGVSGSGKGFAVLRWSRAAACLEALELGVRDERYDSGVGSGYEPPGTVRKLVARFAGAEDARLVEIGDGFELRQALRCRVVAR